MIFKDNISGKRRKKVDWTKTIWEISRKTFKKNNLLRKTLEEDTASHAVYPAEQGRRIQAFWWIVMQTAYVKHGSDFIDFDKGLWRKLPMSSAAEISLIW